MANMAQWLEVKRRIQSLADSTSLEVICRGESVVYRRRRSPYLSHRTAEVGNGHRMTGVVILRHPEHKNWYLIVRALWSPSEIEGRVVEVTMPAFHFLDRRDPGFFEFPLGAPPWMLDGAQVMVAFEDTFNGFDDNGHPMHGEPSGVTVRVEHGDEVITFDIGKEDGHASFEV